MQHLTNDINVPGGSKLTLPNDAALKAPIVFFAALALAYGIGSSAVHAQSAPTYIPMGPRKARCTSPIADRHRTSACS
jgi:hypothetical protein